MHTRRTFLTRTLTGACVLSAAPALLGRSAQAGAGPERIQALIDGAAARARSAQGAKLGLVLGIIGPDAPEGRLLFAGGAGLTSATGAPLPLDAQTSFEIGSISKVFTSALAYQRHGPYAGTLGAALGGAVPLSPAVAALELENLAIYQPGLPQDNRGGVYPPGAMATLDNLFAYVNGLPGPIPQGTCYAYSNLGWALLAMASVGLSGTDTKAFVARYAQALQAFCGTLGARDTHVFAPRLRPQLPMGYTHQWQPLPGNASYAPTTPPTVGAGGIVSTGADMLSYLAYNMGRRPGGLTDAALAYQQTPSFHARNCKGGNAPSTAYGWFRKALPTGDGAVTVLNKDGGVRGFTAWMGFTAWQGTGQPSSHGVFVLANGPPAVRLGNAALGLLWKA
ncbi:serine hydrolase domain-containing protein [Azorhizobium sp. AG788]|uniref:serine hydrolase domain-containing protein n=1 Tax=Azorhizobium sp. AG788 TaxID=2183897 RepID=UPI003139B096